MVEIKIWIFRDLVYYKVPSTWVSRILYVGDLRSGQFRDLPIISQWGKTQVPQILLRSVQIVQNNCPFRLLLMTPMQICIWLCNPWKVIWGHILTSWGQYTFLLITFALIELETWDNRQCFSHRDASNAMQHGLLRSPSGLSWPWLEFKFWSWPFVVNV